MPFHFDINDFRLFVGVVETGSLTRGAERVFLSLPAASQRLKNLEETLGLKLLIRSGQGVKLTDPGKVYLAHARTVLEQLEHLTCGLQEFGAGIKGKLRLLGNTTAITELLPGMLGTYLRTHPGIQLDLRECMSDDIVRAVRDGVADVGIVSGSVLMDRLDSLPVASTRIVVVTPLDHPLAGLRHVSFSEVLEHEHVCLPEGSAIHSFLMQKASDLHRQLSVRVQVSSYDAVCLMVQSGAGVAIIPEPVIARLGLKDRVGVCQMGDTWAQRQFHVVARDFQGLPRFAAEFVDEFHSHLGRSATSTVS